MPRVFQLQSSVILNRAWSSSVAGSVMSIGIGYMVYRRAFCLFWKALYHFQLQTLETAACLQQIQPRGRELSRILSGCQSIPLCGIMSACEEPEPGVQGHWLQSDSVWSCGSVSHADAFSCYKPSHLKDQRQFLWQSLAGNICFQAGKARDVHGMWWVLGSTSLVPGIVACRFLRQP